MRVNTENFDINRSVSVDNGVDLLAISKKIGYKVVHERSGQFVAVRKGKKPPIIIPLDTKLGDYQEKLDEATLEILSSKINLQNKNLLLEQVKIWDVFKLTISGPEAEDNTLPLSKAGTLVRSMSSIISTAAVATIGKSETKGTRLLYKKSTATEFINNTRFAQTGLGSFVFNALLPASPMADEQFAADLDSGATRTFGRQVAAVTSDTLSDLAQVLDENDYIQQSQDINTVKEFPEFCTSIASSLSAVPDSHVKYDVFLSESPYEKQSSSSVSFLPEHLPRLEAIIETARRQNTESVTVVGFVTDLHKDVENLLRRVKLSVVEQEQRLRVVWLELEPSQYDRALDAHRENLPITCTGILRRQKGSNYLENISYFHVPQSHNLI